MRSLDGEGLSQLYLELVDAYKKRFMLQNGQVAVLKCSPISLSYLSLNSSSSQSLETGSYGSQDPLKGCSLKKEILTLLLFCFI